MVHLSMRIAPFVFLFISVLGVSVSAQESENNPPMTPPEHSTESRPPTQNKQYPAVGGHLGVAVPIVTLKSDSTAIGKDFVQLGLSTGLTVHIDEHYAVDFEMIAFNDVKDGRNLTTFVVDPGVIRKFDCFNAGLRVASRVNAPSNVGLIPIIVVPFRISQSVVYYVEADLPLFLNDDAGKVKGSATVQFQSGFAF
jgi:hypothetical protein